MHKNTHIWGRELVIGYGDQVLSKPMDFEISAGSWVTFYGGNGQGKTTLLKTLSGLIPPLEGSCGIAGKHFLMGTVRPFYPALSVQDNLQTFARVYGKTLSPALVDFWGLGELRHEPFQGLSDGEKQRCHLALGELIGADIWLVDEPYLSLDAPWALRVTHFFKGLKDQGTTLLMAQHQANPHGNSICLSATGGDF